MSVRLYTTAPEEAEFAKKVELFTLFSQCSSFCFFSPFFRSPFPMFSPFLIYLYLHHIFTIHFYLTSFLF